MITKKILGEVHSFSEIASSEAVPLRDQALDEKVFWPKLSEASLSLGEISSTSSTTPWYSPGAENFSVPYADLHLLRWAVATKTEGSLHQAWYGALMKCSHHIVVKMSPDTVKRGWFFPLFQVGSSAVIAWPADERIVRHEDVEVQFFVPRRTSVNDVKQVFVACCDPHKWVARSFVWKTPLQQFMAYSSVPRAVWGEWQLVAMPTSASAPLLQVAARCCFWELPKTWLEKVAKAEHYDIEGKTDTFGVLWALVKGILEVSDEEAINIMAVRLGSNARDKSSGGLSALLDCEEIHWCLDKNDQEDLKQDIEDSKSKQIAKQTYADRYHEMRLQVSFDLAAKGPKAKKAKKPAKPARMDVPEHDITQVFAKRFCPPCASIWKSNGDSGWCGHLPPFKRSHYSGVLHSHRRALILQLADLWAKHLRVHALPTSACPWQELHDTGLLEGEAVVVPVGPAAGGAASSSGGG